MYQITQRNFREFFSVVRAFCSSIDSIGRYRGAGFLLFKFELVVSTVNKKNYHFQKIINEVIQSKRYSLQSHFECYRENAHAAHTSFITRQEFSPLKLIQFFTSPIE